MDQKRKRARHSLIGLIGDGSIIAFDTGPLIYYFEDHPIFAPLVEKVFQSIVRGTIMASIATMTFHEILVKPKRQNNLSLIASYKSELLDQSSFIVAPVTAKIAELGADLRTKYPSLKSPDALILATALITGADLLITADKRMGRVKELPVLVLTPR